MSEGPSLANLSAILRKIDYAGDNVSAPKAINSWLVERIEHGEPVNSELLLEISDQIRERAWGTFTSPKALTEFVGLLIRHHGCHSILDPACGVGLLLKHAAETCGAKLIHGIDINPECSRIAQAVLDGTPAKIFLGDAFQNPQGLLESYDLIVAQPPFASVEVEMAKWAAKRLSQNGMVLIVVTNSFPFSRGKEVLKDFHRNGLHLSALIQLPSGFFPETGLATQLAIIERGEQKQVFVGEYSDDPVHQQELVKNFSKRKSGTKLALGRLCDLDDFLGYRALVAREKATRLGKASGWRRVPAESIFIRVGRQDQTDDRPPSQHSLWVSAFMKPSAILGPDQPDLKMGKHATYLEVDPRQVDARFLVHWFNESPIGQATLESISAGSSISSTNSNSIQKSSLYLPPLQEQIDILNGFNHLEQIQHEVNENRSMLWSGMEPIDKVIQQIGSINIEDRYGEWIESLPFPIASILWRHRAGDGTTGRRFEILLHFFEATAAFLATVHLSAFLKDPYLWAETAPDLQNLLRSNHFSLDRPTFGSWQTTATLLSRRCRDLLSKEEGQSTCRHIYGTTDLRNVEMLCNSEISNVLQRANHIRNTTVGHGGAMGDQEANQIQNDLFSLVQVLRGVFGKRWIQYLLIQPSVGSYQNGIHTFKAQRLMGTRKDPFEVIEVESTIPLERDRLYLFSTTDQCGLLLRPFVRVMPSPEKKASACYIYSGSVKGKTKYISYHFEEESSMTQSFPDVEEAIQLITSSGGEP